LRFSQRSIYEQFFMDVRLTLPAITISLLLSACGGSETASQDSEPTNPAPSTNGNPSQTINSNPLGSVACTTPTPLELVAFPTNAMSYDHSPLPYKASKALQKVLAKIDLNNDGLDDLLMGGNQPGSNNKSKVEVLISNGDGTLTEQSNQLLSEPVWMHNPKAITGDFNGDSLIDVIAFDIGDGDLGQNSSGGYIGDRPYVFTQSKAGKLVVSDSLANAYKAQLGSSSMHIKDVTAGDIDNDGDLDLFVESGGGYNQIISHFLMNDGKGNFTVNSNDRLNDDILNGGSAHDGFWRYASHKLVDMNNDGALDLVMGRLKRRMNTQEYNHNKIVFNDGTGRFPNSNILDLPIVDWNDNYTYVKSMIVTDLNRDGAMDLILSHERDNVDSDPSIGNTGRYLQFLINSCNGEFIDETDDRLGDQSNTTVASTVDYNSVNNAPKPMILIDVNNDSIEDLVMAGTGPIGSHAPYVYIGQGDGFFEMQDPLLITNGSWFGEDAYPIDLNNDGVMDFIHADGQPGPDNNYTTGDDNFSIVYSVIASKN